tara:strand:+ start:150 stop:395 length:246 start_codon:yes stop_codon:yes gene_type:complete
MATYRSDGTRIRKRDKKKNRGNVGVGTSAPAGNVGAGISAPTGNVGVGTSAPPPAPAPEPSGPIVSDDRDAEGNVGTGTTH